MLEAVAGVTLKWLYEPDKPDKPDELDKLDPIVRSFGGQWEPEGNS